MSCGGKHLSIGSKEVVLIVLFIRIGQDLSEEFDDAGSIDDICKLMR